MVQYNFKIEEELKAELDKALGESGAENKTAFLQEMVTAFNAHKASTVDTDLDLSKYESVNVNTKEALSDAFKHILTTLDANFSNAKQEAIYIDTEKKALIEKEESFKHDLLELSAEASRNMEVVRSEAKAQVAEADDRAQVAEAKRAEFEARCVELEKEFVNVSKVADQVQVVTAENKDLRESMRMDEASNKATVEGLSTQLKILTDKLTEVEQTAFKAEIQTEQKDKEINSLTEQLSAEKEKNTAELTGLKKEFEDKLLEVTSELSKVQNEYSKALGKLEILEKPEGK